MCFRGCGLICASLFFSCVMHHSCWCNIHGHHVNLQNSHSNKTNPSEDIGSLLFVRKLFEQYGHESVLTFKNLGLLLRNLYVFPNVAKSQDELLFNCKQVQASESSNEQVDESDFSSENSSARSSFENSELSSSKDTHQNISSKTLNYGLLAVTDSQTIKNTTAAQGKLDSHKAPYVTVRKSHCVNVHDLLQRHNVTSQDDSITILDFYQMCPAIVYQIHSGICNDHSDHSNDIITQYQFIAAEVWLYASLSVLAISICGLLSVALIPLIQRLCYHELLQFLVALAVGSLSGDALLHLVPHSMSIREMDQHHQSEGITDFEHNFTVWRGFTALMGIYLFFIAERLLNLVTSYRKMKQRTKVLQIPKYARSLTNVDGEQSRVVGEKLSHHKHGSYGYKFDPASVGVLERLTGPVSEKKTVPTEKVVEHSESEIDSLHVDSENVDFKGECHSDDALSKCTNSEMHDIERRREPPSPIKPLHVDVTYLPSEKQHEQDTPTEECHRETVVYRHAHDDHSYVVTVTDHHHRHGQSHEIPNTVSSVAWMVVMGDGLHNFCDGLAIGAAFGSGISGGISTSVAVLCHELPHELGDFAMLLKAGMSVKQALLYNSISSLLCFLGTLIGVSLGNIASATYWIFAGAAGMFLYIALVDMLPELAAISGHSKHSGCRQLFVQLIGMSIGTCIMLVIAIFEHDLQHLVS